MLFLYILGKKAFIIGGQIENGDELKPTPMYHIQNYIPNFHQATVQVLRGRAREIYCFFHYFNSYYFQ
jgi:hypothetical protein